MSQRFAKQGEVVVTGTMNNLGTRIMVVSDMSKMQVRCRVDEGDAPLVKPDQPLEILRTIHSFDPCMACGVHVLDATGREVTAVKVQ